MLTSTFPTFQLIDLLTIDFLTFGLPDLLTTDLMTIFSATPQNYRDMHVYHPPENPGLMYAPIYAYQFPGKKYPRL